MMQVEASDEGSAVALQRNRIHDGKQDGVFVYDSATCTLDDNIIEANDFTGVDVQRSAGATLTANTIKFNGQCKIPRTDFEGWPFGDIAVWRSAAGFPGVRVGEPVPGGTQCTVTMPSGSNNTIECNGKQAAGAQVINQTWW